MQVKCSHCAKKFKLDEKEVVKLEKLIKRELKGKYEKKVMEEKERSALTAQKVAERTKLQIRALEKQIEQTRASLLEALGRAASGNNQQKGEALELALEEELRAAFPFDKIAEVKKGASGADITHSIRDSKFNACGNILYECKNAKWQTSWIEKLKSDVRSAKADVGVLVALNFPAEWGEFHQIDGHIWIVKPRLTVNFASALRHMLIALATINRNTAIKEERAQFLYNYITGPEFRSRIESLIEGYDLLQHELEKEKRAAQLRWSHQGQTLRMMVDSTYGLYGDFQGMLIGRMEPTLPTERRIKSSPQDIDALIDILEPGNEGGDA